MSLKIILIKLQAKLREVRKKMNDAETTAEVAKLAQDYELQTDMASNLVMLQKQEYNLNITIDEIYWRQRICDDLEFDELCTNMLLL